MTMDELREFQAVERTLNMAYRQVHALDPEHPALEHLQAASDAVTRAAFPPYERTGA